MPRPRWPMIMLRSPKGWTGPREVDGKRTESSWRSLQVPLAGLADNPEHIARLERWMKSYRPEELFDEAGVLRPTIAALAPAGCRRMGANPHANGGILLKNLQMPDYRDYAVEVPTLYSVEVEATRVLGNLLRDVMRRNERNQNFRVFGPDETASNRLGALFDVTNRAWMAERTDEDDHLAPDGRVMEILSEHTCQEWLEGYLLTGRAHLTDEFRVIV